jgi:hypothetical protein
MAKWLSMGSFLCFRCCPPPPEGRIRAAGDLDGGLLGGDGNMLHHHALLAGRPVTLQRLDLCIVGPQQLGRPVHDTVVDFEAGLVLHGSVSIFIAAA